MLQPIVNLMQTGEFFLLEFFQILYDQYFSCSNRILTAQHLIFVQSVLHGWLSYLDQSIPLVVKELEDLLEVFHLVFREPLVLSWHYN